MSNILVVDRKDIPPNTKRGGDIRVLLSPRTVNSTDAFMGLAILEPGDIIKEHYHPYSEEMLYVISGSVEVTLDGKEKVSISSGQSLLIRKNVRHRLVNHSNKTCETIFCSSPLAPRPELGHVDTEE